MRKESVVNEIDKEPQVGNNVVVAEEKEEGEE